jgi:putative endonuclease
MINKSQQWYVYILRCSDGTFYTGKTVNLERRIEAHNLKQGSKYVSMRVPVKLVYQEILANNSLASKREVYIKKLTRTKKIDFINSYLV